MILSLVKDVGDEMFLDLVNAINSTAEGDTLEIYLSSDGGSAIHSLAISDLIDQYKEHIELVAFGDIASAGFEIFFKARCRRRLVPGTYGMYHVSRMSITTDIERRPLTEDDRQVVAWGKDFKRRDAEEFCATLPLTVKEKDKFKKGKDVHFNYERLKEFLDYQQKTYPTYICAESAEAVGVLLTEEQLTNPPNPLSQVEG